MSKEEKTVDELEAKYKAFLEKQIEKFEAQEEAEKEAEIKAQKEQNEKEAQEKYDEMKASIEAELLEKLSANGSNDGSDSGLETGNDSPGDEIIGESGEGDTPMGATKEMPDEYKQVLRAAKITARKKGLGNLKSLPHYSDENFMKAYVQDGIEAFKATDSDSGCEDDVSAWENEDYFVDDIWFELICQSDFLGKIGFRKYNYKAGAGGQIQIKLIDIPSPAHDWGDAASLDPCECISCVSNSFTTYTVQIKKYGDMREICNGDLLLAGNEVKTAVLESMRIRVSERIDNEIWTNIAASTGTSVVTLDSACSQASFGSDGDCCTWSIKLFDDIIDLHDTMWNAGYFRKSNPVLILNKTISAYLKYKDGLNIPPYMQGMLKFEGMSLKGIGEIKVIESCHAPTCASSSGGDVVAVLLDPDRALAEVWAQKPKVESDRNIDCDSTTYALWAYGGFAVIDNNAIGRIVNP